MNFAVRMPRDLHERLKAAAQAEDLSVGQLLRRLAREELRRG